MQLLVGSIERFFLVLEQDGGKSCGNYYRERVEGMNRSFPKQHLPYYSSRLA